VTFDEWLLSDDEERRYVAVALIREFRVATSVPALRELSRRLAHSSEPGAPFERKKVDELAGHLAAGGPNG